MLWATCFPENLPHWRQKWIDPHNSHCAWYRKWGKTNVYRRIIESSTPIGGRSAQSGWVVQDKNAVNLYAATGVAVREFSLKAGHGTADYLLYVNRVAIGVVEAKPEGFTLSGVETQSAKYSTGLPDDIPTYQRPSPSSPTVKGGGKGPVGTDDDPLGV